MLAESAWTSSRAARSIVSGTPRRHGPATDSVRVANEARRGRAMATSSGVGTDLQTMSSLADYGARKFGERPVQRFKRGEEWEERSYVQLAEEARAAALGLVALGIAPGDRVCVLANTRPEWTTVQLAIWMAGGTV